MLHCTYKKVNLSKKPSGGGFTLFDATFCHIPDLKLKTVVEVLPLLKVITTKSSECFMKPQVCPNSKLAGLETLLVAYMK